MRTAHNHRTSSGSTNSGTSDSGTTNATSGTSQQ
jgi:hypothetical protein